MTDEMITVGQNVWHVVWLTERIRANWRSRSASDEDSKARKRRLEPWSWNLGYHRKSHHRLISPPKPPLFAYRNQLDIQQQTALPLTTFRDHHTDIHFFYSESWMWAHFDPYGYVTTIRTRVTYCRLMWLGWLIYNFLVSNTTVVF